MVGDGKKFDYGRQRSSVKTAFIVLTYNRPDALLQVLHALAVQCTGNHEVIIADDGSRPDLLETLNTKLPSFKCPVSHVWHPDVGFTAARARNLAVAYSSADYLVFLDGDCVPGRGFIAAHENLAEPGFFVNGSRVLLSEALTLRIVNDIVDINAVHWSDWIRWRWNGDSNKLIHLVKWPSVLFRKERFFRWKNIKSCNFGVFRQDFLLVNGFDESFQGWGHEDADLVLRLHNAGVQRKNGFCATEVYHLWHAENSRGTETVNRLRVEQRVDSGLVQATQGVNQVFSTPDVKVTSLND